MSTMNDISGSYMSSNVVDINGVSTISTVTNLNSLGIFDINSLYLYQTSTNISTVTDGSGSDPSGNVPFSIQDLINSQQVIIEKENNDRGTALAFANMSVDQIKPQLYLWAGYNFPDGFPVASLDLNPPAVCSDGVVRDLVEYYCWLISMSIPFWLMTMNLKTSGMFFTYSHNGNTTITLHITRGDPNQA